MLHRIGPHVRPLRSPGPFGLRRRGLSYDTQVFRAAENINALLETHDRLSYLLAQYLPEPTRHAFLAIRAFNLEINKINDGGANLASTAHKAASQLSSSMGISTSDMKFRFWSDLLLRVFTNPNGSADLGEPIAVLLRDALRNDLNLDIQYFHRVLQTRRHFLQQRVFASTSDICSYGEGTYSQLNYLTQGLLLSPLISPSAISLLEHSPKLQSLIGDIAAHVGQATAVSSMLLGMHYYAQLRNHVTLPVDLMTDNELSQEDVLRLTQGHVTDKDELAMVREKLQNVVYETAITANDHILLARDKLKKVGDEIKHVVHDNQNDPLLQTHHRRWRRGIPDVIFTPFMLAIPTTLYLNKLERCDFDIYAKSLQQKEWRLPWRSFVDYHMRRI